MQATSPRLKSALQATRLERLGQRFADQGIGDDILDQLQEQDLEKLGVTRMGDRKRLLAMFRKMTLEGMNGSVMLEVKGGVLTEESELAGAMGGILGQHGLPGSPSLPETPPDQFQAPRAMGFNELGIYNMTSNVWEWCWDQDDSQTAHRIRSGTILESDKKNGTRLRISRSPDSRLGVLGFRVARNV